MNWTDFYELIGYLASVIIIISMMMSSLVKLRIVNLTGALLFSIYGFLIGALPVGILNGFVVLVNLYQVYRLYDRSEEFRIIQPAVDGDYIRSFLEHFKTQIKHYQPDFDADLSLYDIGIAVLRNMNVAGVILGKTDNKRTLHLSLDFVIPEYRDMKVGRFVFISNKQYFKDNGFERIVTTGKNKTHIKYLREMGFVEIEDDHFEIKL
ncbi:MAG: YgjV family protein [Salinivirgaceae bacterium]|nr:YgjV family protein [Salinivirgaceae bacterium]MDD4746469.1 YgjV family protein [Salinivirgaceae bacterium]MDY0281058.1 YgjV family protein [Salinivirgaceae bacterium]